MSAVLAALLGLSLCEAQAGDVTPLDAAWKEAVILAGVAEFSLDRPKVVSVSASAGRHEAVAAEYSPAANEIRLYPSGSYPPYYLMVQEFLHSIYHQTRYASTGLRASPHTGSGESWVRERMGWRVRSRAYRAPVARNEIRPQPGTGPEALDARSASGTVEASLISSTQRPGR
jgi:hypothetical protein